MTRHRASLLASTALSGPNGAAVLDLHTAVRIHRARAASSTWYDPRPAYALTQEAVNRAVRSFARSNRVPKEPPPRRASDWLDMRLKPKGSAFVNGEWREIAVQEGAGG